MDDPLSSMIEWSTTYGAVGIIWLAFLERLVPVVPAYALCVAVGIGAANGAWSLPMALVATTVGSVGSCGLWYAVTAGIGELRASAFLLRTAGIFGVRKVRTEQLIDWYRHHPQSLAFFAQLVPTVRLVAPGIAGLLQTDVRTFAISSSCGIVVWNSLFLTVGFFAAACSGIVNASALALLVVVALLAVELLVFLGWRTFARIGICH